MSTLPTKATKPDPEEDAEKLQVPERPGVAKAKSGGQEANEQKVPAVVRGPIDCLPLLL